LLHLHDVISSSARKSKKQALIRWACLIAAVSLIMLAAILGMIFWWQHSLIYHPRPYDESYAHALPANGVTIEYRLPAGKQTAYYIPGREPVPRRLWLAFCGNGSLALDWTTILKGYPQNGDGFLLIDYPGYGRNAGYATMASTRASAEAALHAMADRLQVEEAQLRLGVLGHSLGSAVALDFAARHRVERIVAVAPFTTLREEAARVSGPLSHLLTENYDNRARLAEISHLNPDAKVTVFHGTDDEVIPFQMGRALAQKFSFVEFVAVSGGDHVGVLRLARDKIIASMVSRN
jgi:pimeloyl-ACP methyl ester carboxylesterase